MNFTNSIIEKNFRDFGGQKVYYSTHSFFLSESAVYMIVWNLSKQNSEEERVLYWLKTIRTRVENPIILLVGTHLGKRDLKIN